MNTKAEISTRPHASVVGVEFGHDAQGREGYALLDSKSAEVGFIPSRPADRINAELNKLFAESQGPLSVEEVETVVHLVRGDK